MVPAEWFRFPLLLALLIVPAHALSASDCEYVHNVTLPKVRKMEDHEYRIYEECLFYAIEEKHAENVEGGGDVFDGDFSLIPPINNNHASEKLTITFHETNFTRAVISNELSKQMLISGSSLVTWNDYRIVWDPLKYHVKTLRINSENDIWVPDFTSPEDKNTRTWYQSRSYEFKNIVATYKGQISSNVEFHFSSACDLDFTRFPDDIKSCCLELTSEFYTRNIRYQLAPDLKTPSVSDHFHSLWAIEDVHVAIGSGQEPQITYCIQLSRYSRTLKMELTLPMVISAAVILVAPCFGTLLHQLFVKLFAIMLQLFCFQYLIGASPQIGFGPTMPKIYQFYQFSMVMSLVSLLFTLGCSLLMRGKRKLPPSHRLFLLANVTNSTLCCTERRHPAAPSPSTANNNRVENSPGTHTPPAHVSGYSEDWGEVFIAGNNILSLLFILAYILGTVALCI